MNGIRYRVNEPSISDLEKRYVNDVLEKGWLSAGGEHTNKFENKFSDYLGVENSLAVQSGTAALHLALKAVGVCPGDAVILPNYSCGASISTVTQCGARPIVVDVEPETYGLNAEILETAIIKFKPKALQLVHVYGFVARDTLSIKDLCNKYGVILVEDASEALGATLNGRMVGTFGDIAIVSIRSEKMIGVGEGGVVVTNHNSIFDKVTKLASRGCPFRMNSPYWEKYFYDGEGYNYRLPHLLGAVARAQIERFPEILAAKKRVGEIYRELFLGDDRWTLQSILAESEPVYWLNSLYLRNMTRNQITDLGNFLFTKGIEVRSGFWPLSDMNGFASEVFGLQDNGHKLFDNILVLPSASNLSNDDIKFIFDVVNGYFD